MKRPILTREILATGRMRGCFQVGQAFFFIKVINYLVNEYMQIFCNEDIKF